MTTLQITMRNYLAGDAGLTDAPPGGLGFGVYSQWLKPSGPGSTPAAFDPAQGGRLRRSIVVMDGGEVAHPGRPGGASIRRWDSFPTITIIGEAHQNGKEAIYAALRRCEELLVPWIATIDGNQQVSFRLADALALEESEGFPGNMVLSTRWRATGARTLASV